MADQEKTTSSLFTASANWVVSQGSLNDSISFESSISPTLDDDPANSPTSSPLLVLAPESPDSTDPCEITVSFQQKYEALQIYVKSTAKIYEIYYAINEQSDNEYLCTVRCGVAEQDEELLQKCDPKELKEKCEDETKSSEEGEWEEVKKPNSPANEASDCKLKSYRESDSRIGQDYYEATAEVTDPNPCVSLTLRLLSLQVKGCVQIKEIYIFANPVDSASSVPQIPSGNSSGNSLLTMLVPGLLQASRSGAHFMQDVKHFNQSGREKHANARQEGVKLGITETSKEQEVRSHLAGGEKIKNQEPVGGRSEQGKLKTASHTPVSEGRSFDLNNIERALNQLDYRMSRIEALYLRFEENMMKPLNGIEGRLQRLGQQLDAFKLRSGPTRIVAPEFSCDESGTSSFYEEKSDNNAPDASQVSKGSHLDVSSGLPDLSQDTKCSAGLQTDQSYACFCPSTAAAYSFHLRESFCNPLEPSLSTDLAGNPGICPSLVMTPPEFSCDDEVKNLGESSESVQGGVANKPSMSIDDALASALEAFLASTSVGSSKPKPTFRVSAPEFVHEANDSNVETFLPPTALLSEDPENLLSSSHDSAEVGVEGSCTQNEEGIPLEIVTDSPTLWIHMTANESREIDHECIEGAGATAIKNVDRPDLHQECSHVYLDQERICGSDIEEGYPIMRHREWIDDHVYLDQEQSCGIRGADIEEGYPLEQHQEWIRGSGASASQDYPSDLVSGRIGRLMSDSNESLILEEEDMSNTIKVTFEQVVSSCDPVYIGSDEDILLNIEEVSLDLEANILNVKFVSQEDWTFDASLEDLLGTRSNTEVQASENGDTCEVLGDDLEDQILLVQEMEGPRNSNNPNYEPIMRLDDLNLVFPLIIAADMQEIQPETLLSSSIETEEALPSSSGDLEEPLTSTSETMQEILPWSSGETEALPSSSTDLQEPLTSVVGSKQEPAGLQQSDAGNFEESVCLK